MRAQPSDRMVAGAEGGLVERSYAPGGRSTREPVVGSCASLLGPYCRGWTAESRHPKPAPSGRRGWLGEGSPNSRRGAPRSIAAALPPRRVPDAEDGLRGR